MQNRGAKQTLQRAPVGHTQSLAIGQPANTEPAKGEDGLRLRGVSVLCSAGAGPGIVPSGSLHSCWTWGGDTVPGA